MSDSNVPIHNYFSCIRFNGCYGNAFNRKEEETKEYQYLIVPLKGDRIEIPAFTLNKFKTLLMGDKHFDEMAILLHSIGKECNYKAFAKIMKIALTETYGNKLIRIEGKDADKVNVYYATKGAVFDESFNPLVMCTWILENREVEDAFHISEEMRERKWFFVNPVLRIDPQFYFRKPDNVGRYINKKVVGQLFEDTINVPITSGENNKIGNSFNTCLNPKIEIAECPFELRSIYSPSINITNDILKQIVLDNIEDFI